jgi:uncharacterized protein
MMKQLLTYFGLAYLISWIIWLPLYGHVFGLSDLPRLSLQHALGSLGPLVAAVLTTWIFFKTAGLRNLLKRCLQLQPWLYLAIALFSPFVLAVIASLMSSVFNKTPVDLSGLLKNKEFPEINFLVFFIYNLVLGFGEEVGWRGFALPRLQYKFNALTSSLILTALWALWHIPLFFYRPDFMAMGIGGTFGWFFSLLTGSVLLTWLYNSSQASILICAVFHSTINIAFSADFADKNVMNYMGFLITVWGILTIVVFKPKNLALNARERLP